MSRYPYIQKSVYWDAKYKIPSGPGICTIVLKARPTEGLGIPTYSWSTDTRTFCYLKSLGTDKWIKFWIRILSTGGPRSSRGYCSGKDPRIPKPQICALIGLKHYVSLIISDFPLFYGPRKVKTAKSKMACTCFLVILEHFCYTTLKILFAIKVIDIFSSTGGRGLD